MLVHTQKELYQQPAPLPALFKIYFFVRKGTCVEGRASESLLADCGTWWIFTLLLHNGATLFALSEMERS